MRGNEGGKGAKEGGGGGEEVVEGNLLLLDIHGWDGSSGLVGTYRHAV